MKLFYKLILLVIILKVNMIFGQKIAGYSFEEYKVDVTQNVKKAKINYSSNKIAKEFKTRITDGYKDGKIDFAGHYITIIWGFGSACASGAMVDVLTGNVYEIPLGDSTYFYGCNLKDGEDCMFYNSKSKLFVTCFCTENIINTTETNQKKEFFINVWNEKNKKFTLIKKVIENEIVKSDN